MKHKVFSEEERIDIVFLKFSLSYIWEVTQGDLPLSPTWELEEK